MRNGAGFRRWVETIRARGLSAKAVSKSGSVAQWMRHQHAKVTDKLGVIIKPYTSKSHPGLLSIHKESP